MRHIFSVLLFLLTLTGCATSDLVALDGEYRILKEGGTALAGNFRLASLKADALNEAVEVCAKYNKKVVILNEVSVPVSIGVFARYELSFKCS
jgi:hypothetical protein